MGGCVPKRLKSKKIEIKSDFPKTEEKKQALPESTLAIEPVKNPEETFHPYLSINSESSMQINIFPSLPSKFDPNQLRDHEGEPLPVQSVSKPGSRRGTNLLSIVKTPENPRNCSSSLSLDQGPSLAPSFSAKRVKSHPMTLPPKSLTPFGKLPQIRKTSLLSIPVFSKKKSYLKKNDDSCSDSSEQISDGSSSRCSGQALSISNSNNDLSPYLSDETRIFKSFDLKLQEKIVSCATHVRRTSIVNKEKLSDGGIMVNQYKLLQKVGRGAFGKVFKAVDDLGNTVAVKIYNKRRLRSKWIGKGRTALQLVTSEIEIMQAASHERLINLFEVINQEDYHKIYLVIEYAEGGTLHKRGKFEEQAARKCFKQLIEGLSYLHETLKVIHRDIKPQNILFDSEGNLKIADFGSAQFLQNGQDELTSSAGTYAFMSPEMHGGSKMFKGKPTDIWAAGITLYYMIEGKTPFKSKALLDLMNEVKTEEIVFPNHFSPHLKELLSGMLEKDPDRRISIDEIKQSSWFSIEN